MALASVLSRTLFGPWLRRFLNSARRLRRFDDTMAAVLIASIVPTF
jgi:hypothetical protein